jgi:hypothetical protein
MSSRGWTLTEHEWEAWIHPHPQTRRAARSEVHAELDRRMDADPLHGPAIFGPDGTFLGSAGHPVYLDDQPPEPDPAGELQRDFVIKRAADSSRSCASIFEPARSARRGRAASRCPRCTRPPSRARRNCQQNCRQLERHIFPACRDANGFRNDLAR